MRSHEASFQLVLTTWQNDAHSSIGGIHSSFWSFYHEQFRHSWHSGLWYLPEAFWLHSISKVLQMRHRHRGCVCVCSAQPPVWTFQWIRYIHFIHAFQTLNIRTAWNRHSHRPVISNLGTFVSCEEKAAPQGPSEDEVQPGADSFFPYPAKSKRNTKEQDKHRKTCLGRACSWIDAKIGPSSILVPTCSYQGALVWEHLEVWVYQAELWIVLNSTPRHAAFVEGAHTLTECFQYPDW